MKLAIAATLIAGYVALAVSGSVSASQAIAATPRAEPVDAAFSKWDADHNGVLSLEEFRNGWHGRMAEIAQERLRDQFESIDADGDAAIGPAEYGRLALVRRAGKAAPPLSAFDGNHDGRLQYAEYLALVRRMAAALAASRATSP